MPAILSYNDESYVITGMKLEESHFLNIALSLPTTVFK